MVGLQCLCCIQSSNYTRTSYSVAATGAANLTPQQVHFGTEVLVACLKVMLLFDPHVFLDPELKYQDNRVLVTCSRSSAGIARQQSVGHMFAILSWNIKTTECWSHVLDPQLEYQDNRVLVIIFFSNLSWNSKTTECWSHVRDPQLEYQDNRVLVIIFFSILSWNSKTTECWSHVRDPQLEYQDNRVLVTCSQCSAGISRQQSVGHMF